MQDSRNLILAVLLSIAIIFGFELYNSSKLSPRPQKTVENEHGSVPVRPSASAPSDDGVPPVPGPRAPVVQLGAADRAAAIKSVPRLRIDTPKLHGSISLRGARIDDVTLANYRETLAEDSAEIVLLSPKGTREAYYAEFGWLAAQGIETPDSDTVWTADGAILTPDTPVTLTWVNDTGVAFTRKISIDADYMFTIEQTVANASGQPITVYPFALLLRGGTPKTKHFYILHEGPLGVFDQKLKEVEYSELQEDGAVEQTSVGGWIGITDKYWLVALAPDAKTENTSRFSHRKEDGLSKYQVDYRGPGVTVPAGATYGNTCHFFAGAKEVRVLDGYSEGLGIDNFDLAIDFGWFFFLTKPIFYLLIWLNEWVGNLGIAIMLLTVVIKLLFYPLANTSYRAMSKMKKLQPEIVKLKERFGDDKVRMNQEMMALYKREKTNPALGCLPIIPQIFVFFSLYKVLFVTIEMRQAPFFGWIKDLSSPDPTTVFNLFGLIAWTPPHILMIGVWPLLMGVTMFLQQKLNPTPPDPIQAKIMMWLPVIFTVMLASFPAGLVIYWTWNNILSITQQWWIMRQMGVSVEGGGAK